MRGSTEGRSLRVFARWAVTFAFFLVTTAVFAGSAPALRVIAEKRLPKELRGSWDVRWASDSSVYVAASRAGTLEISLTGRDDAPRLMIPATGAGSLWLAQRLGVSSQFLVAGAPAFEMVWKRRGSAGITGNLPVAMISDLDVREDKLVLTGGRRDAKGQWGSDGAIAWLGSLSLGLADLKPIFFSSSGPGAVNMGRCAALELAKVRFMPDGSFLLVPGVEEGVFAYRASGTLMRTWQTETLGVDAGCPLSDEKAALLARDPEARWGWLATRRIVDEVLPLPQGAGLIVRRVSDKGTRWDLTLLFPDGAVHTIELPLSSPSRWTHLRGDVRGERLVFLMLESGTMDEPLRFEPRLVLMELVK